MKLKTFTLLLFVFCLTVIPGFSQSVLLPPKDLVADVVSDDTVNLSWTLPMDTSVVGFFVYRKDELRGGDFVKINTQMVSGTSYKDKSVKKGSSYTYYCKSVNSDGLESEASNICGAPKMEMSTSALVTHMGRTVRIATPGDVIKYNIDFANNGFGSAKNVVIVYAIPRGTTFISGTAVSTKLKARISYFDKSLGKWVDKVKNEENISRVRFSVLEDVKPVSKTKDLNGVASLKVMVNY